MKKVKLAELSLNDTFRLKMDAELYSIFKICGSVILAKFEGKIYCFSYNREVVVDNK